MLFETSKAIMISIPFFLISVSLDPNCGPAIPRIRNISAINNNMNFNTGLEDEYSGIRLINNSGSPNLLKAFFDALRIRMNASSKTGSSKRKYTA